MTQEVTIGIDFNILSNFLCITEYRPPELRKTFPYSVALTIGGEKVNLHFFNTVLDDDGTAIYPNVDILIGVDDKANNINYKNQYQKAFFRRVFKKTDQVALLNEAADALGLNHYYRFKATNYKNFLASEQPHVLIKPELAAEGLDHFIVDTRRIDPVSMINTMRGFSKELEFIAFINDHHDAISHYSGLGLEPKEEAVGILKDAKHVTPFSSFTRVSEPDFSVQEIVQDIKKEYRVILDKDKEPVFIVPRLRKANQHPELQFSLVDYKQGYGEEFLTEEAGRLDVDIIEVFSDPSDIKDFKRLVQSDFFEPVSSLDLFVCEDGRWGIFEFNPQFGLKVYPLELKFKWHMNYIKEIAFEYLKQKQ